MRIRALVVYLCAASLTWMLVRALYYRGGPYDLFPETVFDHVQPEVLFARQTIVACRRAEPLMPRGATVTVFAPEEAPDYDITEYLTASGMLPRHRVVHPADADPDFIIALGRPLERDPYALVAEFPEGRLYAARR